MLPSSREQLLAMLWNVWMGAGRQLENIRMCRKMSSKYLCSLEAEREREPALHVFSGPTTVWRVLVTPCSPHSLPTWGGLTLGCCKRQYFAKQEREPLGLWDDSFIHLLEYDTKVPISVYVMTGKRCSL